MSAALLLLVAGANPNWPAEDPNLEPAALSRPEQMPDDPEYPPRAECSGQLELYSFTPACTPDVDHPALGSGIHADRAWLLTTGRADVTIAFVGGGIDFSDRDLVARFLLNLGELPAPSTSSAAHDANGDGAFTVLDYTTATGTVPPTIDRVSDALLLARVDRGDTNRNGLLDPADLIAIYSDATDGDSNGYTDDIAGWDFLEDDNDPSDRDVDADANRALATANNEVGGAGVCPGCTLLPLRAGRDGMGGARRMAVAIAYAVDQRASVIASSLAAPDHDGFFRAAIDYAFSFGVPMVASSGLSSSVVQGAIWPPDRVLIAGGLGHDRRDRTRATTALAPDPCASYGPRVRLAAPARCESTAGLIAGVLGLLRSVEKGIPRIGVPALERALAPDEIMMLVAGNTDDAAEEGWDQRTGYGRINAKSSLDALIRRRIPVPVQITAPGWQEVLDPTRPDNLVVRGLVSNRRYVRASWQLAYAAGIDPEDGEFVSLATGTVGEGEDALVEGAIPPAGLLEDPTRPPRSYDALAFTIRLRSSATSGGDVVSGEVRRVVFVQRDLELFPAFPLALAARPTSPRIADVDGDGNAEIAVATSQGLLHLIGPRGSTQQGWPRRAPVWSFAAAHAGAPAFASGALELEVSEPILGAPAIGPSLVVAVTSEGSVLAFDPAGASIGGFPLRLERGEGALGIDTSPALADLDGDGSLDILIADGVDRLYAFSQQGQSLPGFPLDLDERGGAPAIGDVDGDGLPDIAVAGQSRLFLFHADGTPHPGWPIMIAGIGGSVSLADTDGDELLELVLASRGQALAIYEGDASPLLSVVSQRELGPDSDASLMGAPIVSFGQPAIADVDGDGALEAFLFALPQNALLGLDAEDEIERLAGAWSLDDGTFAPAYPRRTESPSPSSAVAADVDGDHRPELITADGRYRLVAFSVNGRDPALWPKLTGGTADGSPAAGDLDGDGNLDVVAATREGALFAWRTQSSVDGIAWEGFGHDNRASHNASEQVSVRAETDLEGGCGCTSARAGSSSAEFVIAIIALALLRLIASAGALARRSI